MSSRHLLQGRCWPRFLVTPTLPREQLQLGPLVPDQASLPRYVVFVCWGLFSPISEYIIVVLDTSSPIPLLILLIIFMFVESSHMITIPEIKKKKYLLSTMVSTFSP